MKITVGRLRQLIREVLVPGGIVLYHGTFRATGVARGRRMKSGNLAVWMPRDNSFEYS